MEVVVEHRDACHEVDLEIDDPRACVSELVNAFVPVTAATVRGLLLDGRFFGLESGLDELRLYEGAVLRLVDDVGAVVPGAGLGAGPVLAVVGGPVAGETFPLAAQPRVLGRAESGDIVLDDPTLSEHHAEFHIDAQGRVIVADLDSRNGTWIDGQPVVESAVLEPGQLVRMGATYARVWLRLPDDRPLAVDPARNAVGGVIPFNRPPRPAPPPTPERLAPPRPSQGGRTGGGFNLAMVLGPLVAGAVVVAITRRWEFALFTLLSPIMVASNWIGTRRQARKHDRLSARAFREASQRFTRELAAARDHELARLDHELPDPAEIARRARLPSWQLWQCRPDHPEWLRVRAGIGNVPWSPPVIEAPDGLDPEVEALVTPFRVLPDAPVEVDLAAGGVVGLVGNRRAAVALARSLVCQAAVNHGPADLGMAILVDRDQASVWDWAKWLPHVRDLAGASRLCSADRAASTAILERLIAAAESDTDRRGRGRERGEPRGGRTLLFVLDDVSLTEGRRAPARLLLGGAGGPAAGIVIAETEDRLPAVCTTVIELRSDLGDASLRRLQARFVVDEFVIGGMTEATARSCALALARYEDPELEMPGVSLPPMVRLLPLLGMDNIAPSTVLAAWQQGLPDPAPNTPIAIGEDGPVHLNLVTDGPHGLVGGTTGAGKSELLRSLVAGMAARVDPDHLVFVLVDYKGGSAFDLCSRLPHVVGMVTDLDEHLGERALRSLEAELQHRETLLREAGAQDLPEYLAQGARLGALPRLVVIVDEFAALATELPDFLGALVGIAQRGRSLGIHLLLATQRPSGAVNANIRANTNLRIALRVQDAADSTDIIDRPDAAKISRATPGRAYIRLGPSDVMLAQTALSTGIGLPGQHGVRLIPFRFDVQPAGDHRRDGPTAGATDLERLVAAVGEAFAQRRLAPPRRPWLEMLPERAPLEDILGRTDSPSGCIPFVLADEPGHQRQVPLGWTPAEGPLAVYGMVGAGTTTALLSLARAIAERHSPDQFHVYALDFGAGGLAPLTGLPHTGAVIPASEREAQFRLMRFLRAELDRRRDLDAETRAGEATLVVLVDGIGAFLAEHDRLESVEVADAVGRLFSEGPAVGIVFVVAADRVGALPARLAGTVSQRLLMRLADPTDFATAGLNAKQLPKFVPGRAVHAERGLVVQVGEPGDLTVIGPRLAERWSSAGRFSPPRPIRTLPATVPFTDVRGLVQLDRLPIRVPVGVSDDDLGPAYLTLHEGEHAMVVGPARSGKSWLLCAIAHLLAGRHDARVVGVCDPHSPLADVKALDALGPLPSVLDILRAAPSDHRRSFVLVDDAPALDDIDGVMEDLLAASIGVHVIVAGRTEEVRAAYSHWSRQARTSRTGILLQPNLDLDGDILNARLPRRLPVSLGVGRGFLVTAGEPVLVQFARPPRSEQSRR